MIESELLFNNDSDDASFNNEDETTRLDENKKHETSSKMTYKGRKLEHKLKKYEAIIKKLENITRLYEHSQVN
jgi:hypothetical protein